MNEEFDDSSKPFGGTDCGKKQFSDGIKTSVCGLFLIMCAMCNMVKGWHFMPTPEGRRDLYAAVYQYFRLPPLRIFYDFSCGAEEYCKNRIPNFFYGVSWFHDIFHGYDHRHCTSTQKFYDMGGKPKYNTSACEQFNSIIRHIGPLIKGMRWDKACLLVQVFTFAINRQREKAHFEEEADIALFVEIQKLYQEALLSQNK